jgi:DNA-directed RNA polymerase specialized sigma24 family protein
MSVFSVKTQTLTQEAFDKLLACLSANRDEAGAQYEVMRRRLVRFFEWRGVAPADEYGDETINRVARRIDEGQEVNNLRAYVYGVARMVLKEAVRDRDKEPVALDAVTEGFREEEPAPVEPEPRVECFDRCLEELPPESKSLILQYYQEERRAKIELRQQLADRLSIPLNALRIRAHRIRVSLEKCIAHCLQAAPEAK